MVGYIKKGLSLFLNETVPFTLSIESDFYVTNYLDADVGNHSL